MVASFSKHSTNIICVTPQCTQNHTHTHIYKYIDTNTHTYTHSESLICVRTLYKWQPQKNIMDINIFKTNTCNPLQFSHCSGHSKKVKTNHKHKPATTTTFNPKTKPSPTLSSFANQSCQHKQLQTDIKIILTAWRGSILVPHCSAALPQLQLHI